MVDLFPNDKFSNLLSENGELFLKQVFDKYYNELCKLSYKYVGRAEIAEDIVQDVFINIWNKRIILNNNGNIKPYLIRSVINSSINFIQSKYARQTFTNEVDALSNIHNYNYFNDIIVNELNNLIKQSIEKLPDKCRIIFLLSRFTGYSYNEIAEKLGISVKTVETQISLALKRIGKFLNEGGYYHFIFLL